MELINKFLDYTKFSEAPESFRLWSGLGLVSSLIGRRFWFEIGQYRVYGNVFLILAAPPGCGKSVTIQDAKEICTAVKLNLNSDSVTPSSLISEIVSFANGNDCIESFICNSEFASFFASSKPAEFAPDLCHLWDCDNTAWQKRTHIRGVERIDKCYLSILGGMTEDKAKELLAPSVVGSGLTSRIIFIYADKKGAYRCFKDMQSKNKQLFRSLVNDCKSLYRVKNRKLTIVAEAIDCIDLWYITYNAFAPPEVMRGYYERKRQHILKLALLHAVASFRDTILQEDIEFAINQLDSIELGMQRLLSGASSSEDLAGATQLIKLLSDQTGTTIDEMYLLKNMIEVVSLPVWLRLKIAFISVGILQQKGMGIYKINIDKLKEFEKRRVV